MQTLWKRHEETGKILEGQYSLEEFSMINKWQVQEKIDGTNIRIRFYLIPACYSNTMKDILAVEFKGRTDEAQIPPHLLKYLYEHFTIERLSKIFDLNKKAEITLFGEGYGPKIQGPGGNYREDAGFILFDIKVGDWWLTQYDVEKIAESLEIPYAPIIGRMNKEEIIEYVKSKPLSLCSRIPQVMEGIIARTDPLLLLRNGDRLIFKLKVKDFKD